MSAEPTERELELGADLAENLAGSDELGFRIAELLAERRAAAVREIMGLHGLLDGNASEFWSGYVDGLVAAAGLVRRVSYQ